jgi:hypothetical protein
MQIGREIGLTATRLKSASEIQRMIIGRAVALDLR